MNTQEFITGTEDNHTHIKFYFEGGSMVLNAFTHQNVYPNAMQECVKFEYLIKADSHF